MCVHACSIEREEEYMFVSGCDNYACMIVHVSIKTENMCCKTLLYARNVLTVKLLSNQE